MRVSDFEKCSELDLVYHHQFYSECSYSVAQLNYFNILFELTGDLTYGNIGSMVTCLKLFCRNNLRICKCLFLIISYDGNVTNLKRST
jgi:hypothetical protein